jgi:amino acid transporter
VKNVIEAYYLRPQLEAEIQNQSVILADNNLKRSFFLKNGESELLTSKKQITNLFQKLKVIDTNLELIRVGGKHDGGYIVPNDLQNVKSLFSPGVDKICEFELEFASRGVACYLADASVSDAPARHSNFHFVKKFVHQGPDEGDFINFDNWSPFIPEATQIVEKETTHNAYGLTGIVSGAAAIFFAYVGFDAVSTQAGEAINPKKDVPFAIIASLLICTTLYILVSLVLTGMMNYQDFNPLGKYPDAIKAPVAYAFDIAGQGWAGLIITIAATVGLVSVLMVMIMGQSRIFLGMSKDGLIPQVFSRVNPISGTPKTNLMILGGIIAVVAAFTPINELADMTSFGTLFAFTMVCIAVWILRVKQPELVRTFKVPALPVIAVCGILINTYLMVNLSLKAQLFSGAWLLIGILVYFGYSKSRSKLNNDKAE